MKPEKYLDRKERKSEAKGKKEKREGLKNVKIKKEQYKSRSPFDGDGFADFITLFAALAAMRRIRKK